MREVAAGFDEGQTADALGRAAQRLLPRREECELELILCVQAVQPRKDLVGVRKGLAGDGVERLLELLRGDGVDGRLVEELLEAIGRVGDGDALLEL